MTVAVTGATGLIGSALVERLRSRGLTVRRLLRSPRGAAPGDVVWDPASGAPPHAALAGVDAVINLAGEPIAHRWTRERKRRIRASRVTGTANLAKAIAMLHPPPKVMLSGSAIGYYGDRADELLTESSAPGDDFLARVAADWEQSAQPVADAGVRLVLLRTGVVLTPSGGALAKLLPQFRLGVGGPIGNGRQWLSWISLNDHVRAMVHALETESVHGPLNLTSPNPVRNAQFAETLGHVVSRPAILPVPAFALELMFGEMARTTLLASQRALPAALSASGFQFEEGELEVALRKAG